MHDYIFFFAWGFVIGGLLTLVFQYFVNRNKFILTKKEVDEFGFKMQKMGRALQNVKLVEELSNQQAKLIVQLSIPSKNASHARHRSNILEEVKELEQAKIKIFKSIVDDGVDPLVKVYDNDSPDKTKKITMSEAILRHEANQKNIKESTRTDSNPPRGNHLRLVKGEQSNDTNSETIH